LAKLVIGDQEHLEDIIGMINTMFFILIDVMFFILFLFLFYQYCYDHDLGLGSYVTSLAYNLLCSIIHTTHKEKSYTILRDKSIRAHALVSYLELSRERCEGELGKS
jgi:hypothetical protein